MIGNELYSQSFGVREVSGFKPGQSVEGHIAFSQLVGPGAFMDVVESLGDKTEEGIIAVLAGEHSYSETGVLGQLARAGVVFNGILTFGGVGTSEHIKESHLTIVARDLEVPLCLAKRPWGYKRSNKEYDWLDNGIPTDIHAKLGSLTLSDHPRRINLKAFNDSTSES